MASKRELRQFKARRNGARWAEHHHGELLVPRHRHGRTAYIEGLVVISLRVPKRVVASLSYDGGPAELCVKTGGLSFIRHRLARTCGASAPLTAGDRVEHRPLVPEVIRQAS